MNSNKGCILEPTLSFASTNLNQHATENVDHVITLIPKSTPQIIRKCARCDGDRFASSEKFRVNANKKIIDVWLVFKCISCDYTLNVSIISRKSVANIDRNLLQGFYENNAALAWKYAFDPAYIENGMSVDWKVDFEIERQETILCNRARNKDIHDQLDMTSYLIRSHFFMKMSISIILRSVFNMSRSQLDKLYSKGDIKLCSFQEKVLTLKNNFGFGCRVLVLNL